MGRGWLFGCLRPSSCPRLPTEPLVSILRLPQTWLLELPSQASSLPPASLRLLAHSCPPAVAVQQALLHSLPAFSPVALLSAGCAPGQGSVLEHRECVFQTSASQALMCLGITWGSCQPTGADSDSVGPRWGLRFCISSKLPGDVHATGQGPSFD